MRKVYISKSDISIKIKVGENKYKHLSFISNTVRGSYYITDNETEQKGLEAHPRFGSLFFLEGMQNKPVKQEVKPKQLTVVNVTDTEDAKEYLVENFNISRTKIRTIDQLKKEAELNGIEFKGI